VVLDNPILEIMRRYDEVIGKPSLCPNRKYFFLHTLENHTPGVG
jgi:hypothetical protein